MRGDINGATVGEVDGGSPAGSVINTKLPRNAPPQKNGNETAVPINVAEQGARKIRTQMLRVTSGHNPEQRYSSHGERPIAFIAPVGSHRRNGPTRPPPSMRRDDCHQVALGRAALGVPSQGTPAQAQAALMKLVELTSCCNPTVTPACWPAAAPAVLPAWANPPALNTSLMPAASVGAVTTAVSVALNCQLYGKH